MGRTKTHPLAMMSREEIIEHVRALYRERGPSILTFAALKKERLYFHLYQRGIRQAELVAALGAKEDYDAYKAAEFITETATITKRRWTWQRVLDGARAAMEAQGFLPPAQWFQVNNQGALVAAVYKFGKTWETLREELGCFASSDYVESRSGLRWKSHPEASLSNFLHARGIIHKVGEKYPDAYAEASGLAYGYYDLHFLDAQGRWIDVEIWGDKPNGHKEAEYGRKRGLKEVFNRENPNFLGIEHRDCFSESALTRILRPYIGEIEPFVFDRPTDAVLHSTHWSNADELIDFCRALAAQQPDKMFPSEGWLRKRGRFRNREGAPYNTLSIYIKKWIGGVRKLRQILGQGEHSTIRWSREIAIERYRDFYKAYGFTAGQARSPKKRETLGPDVVLYAHSICHAVEVYAGGVEALNRELEITIDRSRKWNKQKILDGFKALHERYGLMPGQIANAQSKNVALFKITEEDIEFAKCLGWMAQEYFGRCSDVYGQLGIQAEDIRSVAKRRRLQEAVGMTT